MRGVETIAVNGRQLRTGKLQLLQFFAGTLNGLDHSYRFLWFLDLHVESTSRVTLIFVGTDGVP